MERHVSVTKKTNRRLQRDSNDLCQNRRNIEPNYQCFDNYLRYGQRYSQHAHVCADLVRNRSLVVLKCPDPIEGEMDAYRERKRNGRGDRKI